MYTAGQPGASGPPGPVRTDVTAERSRLINLAYRLLGSLAEAEDAVQEALTKWVALSDDERAAIDSPAAWLTTVTSRICLDVLRSARVRRERYVGEWVPEPVPDRTDRSAAGASRDTADPADRITLDESVDMAFLVVLEAMTPAERVAFLLHDVFGYSFPEIGEIVGRTPAACRQLAATGRRRVREGRPRVSPTSRRSEMIAEFKRAWEAKDIRRIVGVLAPEIVITADGGGLVPAALQPIEGAEQVARYLVALAARRPGLALLERAVNGQPGLVGTLEGVTVTVFAFEVADDRITRVWAVRNPEKLRPWTIC